MTDRDQTVIFSLDGGNGEPDRLGVYDDFAATENRSADFVPGLVSLGFITAAIRRSARFLFVMAVIGPIIGGVYFRLPIHTRPRRRSCLRIVPTRTPSQRPPTTRPWRRPVRWLGSLCRSWGYSRASAASSHLHCHIRYRPASKRHSSVHRRPIRLCFEQLPWPGPSSVPGRRTAGQLNLVLQSLDQQINQAKQRVNSIGAQISQLSSQPTSPTQQSQISKLRAEQTNTTNTLANFSKPSPATRRLPSRP